MRKSVILLAVLTGGFCSQASAGILTATETVTGSGVLDGTTFTNAQVTITGTFNTSTFFLENPSTGSFASVTLTSAPTVSVGGVSDTLTGLSKDPNGSVFNAGGHYEIDSTALSEGGLPVVFNGADIGFEAVVLILSTSDSSANYATALQGAGSFSGTAGIPLGTDPNSGARLGFQFSTVGGPFFELDSTSAAATFTISGGTTSSSVPEPGSLALAGFGAVGLVLGAWRKRRDQKAA